MKKSSDYLLGNIVEVNGRYFFKRFNAEYCEDGESQCEVWVRDDQTFHVPTPDFQQGLSAPSFLPI